MAVFTWTISTNDKLVQSADIENPTTTAPSSNVWIGSRVRARRTSRGMTQQDLSDLLGVDRNNLAAYEAGAERINADLLLRIAKFLDVRPDYFFRGYK
jgi:DNA-binding XRE family transcriptional regulator